MWLQNQLNVTAEMKSMPGISVLVQRGRGLLGNVCLENSLVWWAQTTCPWLKQSHWAYEDKGFEEQSVEVRPLLLLNWCHSLFWTSWQVMLWAVEWPLCVSCLMVWFAHAQQGAITKWTFLSSAELFRPYPCADLLWSNRRWNSHSSLSLTGVLRRSLSLHLFPACLH